MVALLAVVALGVAAATLDSTVVPGGGSGFGGGDDAGVGDDSAPNGTGSPAPTNRSATGPAGGSVSACLPFLQEPPALFAGLLLFGGLFVATYRSTKSRLAGLAVCGAVGLPAGLLWAALAFCGSRNPTPMTTPTPTADRAATNATGGAEGGSGGLGGGVEALSSPSLLIALFVVVALLVVVVAALSAGSGRGSASKEPPDEELPDEEPAEAVGRLAGSAADRIDAADADAENEVYRAWTRMTAALDVESPETTTPREFQRAAVEAGMDRSDVTALTELFESVRYGGLEPTDEQETRAVETLRRIEADYGGD